MMQGRYEGEIKERGDGRVEAGTDGFGGGAMSSEEVADIETAEWTTFSDPGVPHEKVVQSCTSGVVHSWQIGAGGISGFDQLVTDLREVHDFVDDRVEGLCSVN